MPETAKRTARVPILGEDGRISDDYIPAAIPEAAEKATAAASRAESAATAAESAKTDAEAARTSAESFASNAVAQAQAAKESADGAMGSASQAASSASAAKSSEDAASASASSAADSSADAMGFRNNAVQYRDQAREAAQEAQGYVSTVQQLEQNATNSATAAQNSATAASASAETATTAASQASTSATNAAASAQTASEKAASVLDHYIESATAMTLDPGSEATATVADKVLQLGIPKGDKGDPGEVSSVQAAAGSDISVSTDEGTVTIDDSALRARIAELEQQAQNVVTGTSTGLVAHGEDAFPQKPIEVRVKGKTWVNRWPVINQSFNGITVSTDDTGLITVSGTASANFYASMPIDGIAANKNYALLISSNVRSDVFIIVQTGSGGSYTELVSNAAGTTDTGTTPASFDSVIAAIQVSSGTTVNASFRVMLVDGTEAPDCFTPPASIASVQTGNLVTAGKNVLPMFDTSDARITRQSDGGYKFSGEVGPSDSYVMLDGGFGSSSYGFPSFLKPNQTYCFSQTGDLKYQIFLYLINGDTIVISKDHNTRSIPDASIVKTYGVFLYLEPYRGSTVNTIIYPQLELGSTATSYEPPNITTTALPEVELRSLPDGTCDELVIKADGTCEVERRTGYIASYADEEVTGEYVSTGNGLEAGASIVYELDKPTTEPQSPVTLPALPAPTFNQYHDSPVPSDTSTEYARDINIVLANLEAVQAALLGGE